MNLLSVISAGLGQDFGGLLCGVEQIKYNNYNCDNLTAFHIVKVLTVGVHNQFVDDSDLVFDGNNNYYLLLITENEQCGLMVVEVNENCNEITAEVIKIKSRIIEIKERLKEFEVN